jgi:ribosomal protein S18 acetylase RimI-like enzyme
VSSVVSTLRRCFAILRDEGAITLWFKALGELGFRRVWVFEVDPRQIASLGSAAEGAQFQWLSEHTLADYVGLVPWGDEATARDRLRAGHFCLLAYADGQAVHSRWIAPTRARIDYLGVDIEPAPDAVYNYEIYVSERFRGGGIANAGAVEAARFLLDQGVARACSVVMPENDAGMKLVARQRYRRIGRLRTLRLLGRRWSWLRTSEPNPPFQIAR